MALRFRNLKTALSGTYVSMRVLITLSVIFQDDRRTK